MDVTEHDDELRDAVRALLHRCDKEGRLIAAIHLEQAWLALGGCLDPEWLQAQAAVLDEAVRDGTADD